LSRSSKQTAHDEATTVTKPYHYINARAPRAEKLSHTNKLIG